MVVDARGFKLVSSCYQRQNPYSKMFGTINNLDTVSRQRYESEDDRVRDEFRVLVHMPGYVN